ncbi:hypothetical protein NR798_43705 [Archangium gephyra]|uniref:hypothetical protein n=1 Tax=Archangium gephyra TaxID=48 RepID=UPI0035D4298A
MQRSRSTVRVPEATLDEVPGDLAEPVGLAEPPPSPRSLLEEVRTPGAARAEVDALLSGLARPLEPGESARERAELLHEIMQDTEVREYLGSGGRKVGHVAVLRLAELGFPYALEVPPELYAEARGTGRGVARFAEARSPDGAGGGLVGIAGGLEVLPALFFLSSGSSGEVDVSLFWVLVVSLTSFIPALLADSAPVLRRRWLHYLMLGAVVLPGLAWLAAALFLVWMALANGGFVVALFFIFPLGMALLRLAGARGLYGSPPAEEPPETAAG